MSANGGSSTDTRQGDSRRRQDVTEKEDDHRRQRSGENKKTTTYTLLILRDLYPSPEVVLEFLKGRLVEIAEQHQQEIQAHDGGGDWLKTAAKFDRKTLESASVKRDAFGGRDAEVTVEVEEVDAEQGNQCGGSSTKEATQTTQTIITFEILYRPLSGPAKREPSVDEWTRAVAALGSGMPDRLVAALPHVSSKATTTTTKTLADSKVERQSTEGGEEVDVDDMDLLRATPNLRFFQVYSAGTGHLEGSRYWEQLDRRERRSEEETQESSEPESSMATTTAGGADGDSSKDRELERQREKQIWASAAGIHVVPIAEHVIGTVLSLFHAFPRLIRAATTHSWISMPDIIPHADRGGFFIRELRGRTMGVMGYGHIGRECARMARAMGMRVVAANRKGSKQAIGGYLVEGTGDHEGEIPERWYSTENREDLAEFYATCDVVVNTLPSSSATRGFVDAQAFRDMRDDAMFVNIGRGDTVDQGALIEALQAGLAAQEHGGEATTEKGRLMIASASLDVTTPEPLPTDSPLWSLPNVLLTPHMSGGSELYWLRASDLFAMNVWRVVVQGRGALNAVRGRGEQ